MSTPSLLPAQRTGRERIVRPDDRLCSRLDHTQGEEVALKHSGVAVLGAQVDRTRLYPIVPLEESAIGAHIEQPHELGARAGA